MNQITPQKTRRIKKIVPGEEKKNLYSWANLFFEKKSTASNKTKKMQKRYLRLFFSFLEKETGNTFCDSWTPRLAKSFQLSMQNTFNEDGSRVWSDRTINNVQNLIKPFANFVHENRPFPLGSPLSKVKKIPVSNQLEIERAITKQERNRILDSADQLVFVGGRSRDRQRSKGARPPQRKTFRPFRNRAIIYTLIETGMRRTAITRLNLNDIDFEKRILSVKEKGGGVQPYPISSQGLEAVKNYIDKERSKDNQKWNSSALFLSPASNPHGNGRLSPQVINTVWNKTRDFAGVSKDKTPHSARHGMGAFIMEKTGNVSAVQRQLGHKNASFSMQYSRISNDELKRVLDER